MANNEVYIGSMSPVISITDQRILLKVTRQLCSQLTFDEYTQIMNVYNKTIDRIFKENGVDENDTEVT